LRTDLLDPSSGAIECYQTSAYHYFYALLSCSSGIDVINQ